MPEFVNLGLWASSEFIKSSQCASERSRCLLVEWTEGVPLCCPPDFVVEEVNGHFSKRQTFRFDKAQIRRVVSTHEKAFDRVVGNEPLDRHQVEYGYNESKAADAVNTICGFNSGSIECGFDFLVSHMSWVTFPKESNFRLAPK
jgi:hypothetical protein